MTFTETASAMRRLADVIDKVVREHGDCKNEWRNFHAAMRNRIKAQLLVIEASASANKQHLNENSMSDK